MVKQPECEYLSLYFFKPDLDRVAPGLLRRFIIFQSYDAPAGKLVYACIYMVVTLEIYSSFRSLLKSIL